MPTESSPTILVVEDDPTIRNLVLTTLDTQGFRHLSESTGRGAIAASASSAPDVVLLDLGLPDIDGIEVVRAIRSWSQMPIIVVSARSEDADKIGALDAGADDYLTKPFSPQELVLRVYAVLRRCYPETSTKLALAHCVIDFDAIEVVREDETKTNLTAKELTLLTILSHNPNRIVTTDRLCEECWGSSFGYEQSLMTHIRRIREKIEKDPSNPESLITMKGLGYKLMVDPSKQ